MLKNNGSIELETERLILKKFSMEYIEGFYKNVGDDYEVTKYVTWDRHKDINETKELFEKWIKDYEDDYRYRWIVILKDTNEVIGTISCVHVDIKNETTEIGYCYGSKFWNNGYGTEALKKVIDYLFDEGFHTLHADYLEENPASARIMIKAGMKYEGTFKYRIISKVTGKYDDLSSCYISKEE